VTILVLSHQAEADLEHIADHIAKDSPLRALSFVQELRQSCHAILEWPERHPVVPRYATSGLRRRVHGNYLIFFRIKEQTVEIIHILHGAMDFEAILTGRHGET
jgi:toxin ParE1/3/4